ncbi:hypothetical protein OIV83_001898 [Microbotryomycetes sp. JL201]|nr:hypothetical protein OIV83_001898 [Microbotryomycetes sp. JL201]
MPFKNATIFARNSRPALLWIVWPILASSAWLATLLGLLLWWTIADDAKRYETDQATIAYVSDVGAAHQALCIAGSSATAGLYLVTLLLLRWMRHLRRLPGTINRREAWARALSLLFGMLGGLFLILLSCFNNQAFPTAHWILALMFLLSEAASALFQVLEIHFLSRSHPDRKHLKRNVKIKAGVIVIAFLGAVGFFIA